MSSIYGEENRADWKKAGLSDYEIYCIIHEPPFSQYYCKRELGDTEKTLVASWIKKGLNFSQIARLLNVKQLHLRDYLDKWDYKAKY